MGARSGRGGTGSRPYRRNRAILLASNDVCAICGHPGSRTADHIIAAPQWPTDATGKRLPGFDSLSNLQPAHGTMGAGRGTAQNRCPTCGRLCNQSKGAGRGRPRRQNSRDWLGTQSGS